jgi:ABC-type phosphate/phosphonate transport system ATPase subunit
MLKIIIGVKGTGKTKTLIEMINSALDNSKGSVVCIEKGDNLKLTLSYNCRLINSDEYCINDAQSLYGFIAGLLASNHDITDLFIDATFRICNRDLAAFDKFVVEADKLATRNDVNLVMTLSMPAENATENIKKYL